MCSFDMGFRNRDISALRDTASAVSLHSDVMGAVAISVAVWLRKMPL